MSKISNIVLFAGHNSTERGASNKDLGLIEWVCAQILNGAIYAVAPLNFNVDVITDDNLTKKVKRVNEGSYDLCVDVHFNSSTIPDAHGMEVLYCALSEKGKNLAECVLDQSVIDKRRIVPVPPHGNGCYFLWKTRPIALIWEVCFINNTNEILECMSRVQDIAFEFWNSLKKYNNNHAR